MARLMTIDRVDMPISSPSSYPECTSILLTPRGMVISYLVSTAGHSQQQNDAHPHDIETILQLIHQGADEFGEEKVVGFTSIKSDEWICDRYSYPELLKLSGGVAASLIDGGLPVQHDGDIISLLCPTGLDFLLAWIALMRMGYGVVLIAPQCSPSAVSHLYTSTSSKHLIYHEKYTSLAQSAHNLVDKSINLTLLPTPSTSTSSQPLLITAKPDTVSHIFHSSGTSGTPKPIPHTHLQSTYILPRRSLPSYIPHTDPTPPSEAAAFTTTPLFHGGISDLLRAWMARSVIYFYPTSDQPITVDNVVAAVEVCNAPTPLTSLHLGVGQENERRERFRVFAFLSVPYILSVLAEDLEGKGMEMLKGMDFVSTGGAPLDTKIGDEMVKRGVKLVSRLGSSECGFLLSSHRGYEHERDWEWLRNDSGYSDALVFEKVEEGEVDKYEMVVTDKWSSKTKTNREDGSYATGDLYIQHPTKKGVWKYTGRGDDVIVLSNGEKASPGPIETTFRSSPLLSDALVIGSNQPQLGLLLFPRASPPPSSLLSDLTPFFDIANSSSPSFAQVAPEMCIIISDDNGKVLPKSSKGTVQRGLAYEVFKEEIEGLYLGNGEGGIAGEVGKRELREIEEVVKGLILDVGVEGKGLEGNTDLFSWGVNSLMATRIRAAMIKNLNTGGKGLPQNIVFEKPSISRLSKYIYDLQENNTDGGEENPHQLMEDLVKKYGDFSNPPSPSSALDGMPTTNRRSGKTILLTGGTGSLGTFLISQLATLPRDVLEKIICLVRASDDTRARDRLIKELKVRDMDIDLERVEVYASDLSDARLGLGEEVYSTLIKEVDVVVHAAWPVHFASSLVSFESNIKGTRNLINLISQSTTSKLHFCSSLASVLAGNSKTIAETPSPSPDAASPIGYSQSKWVTEKICAKASETLGGRVRVMRIGQLCGDTVHGRWNEKEGWPLMIKTAEITGCLPVLTESPSWLPVDLASRSMIDILLQDNPSAPFIYHIVHPKPILWTTILDGLESTGLEFKRVEPKQWLSKMEESTDDAVVNPSKQMLWMWKQAYGASKEGENEDEDIVVETNNAQKESRTLREIEGVGGELIGKMVKAWRKSGFLGR